MSKAKLTVVIEYDEANWPMMEQDRASQLLSTVSEAFYDAVFMNGSHRVTSATGEFEDLLVHVEDTGDYS